LGAVDSGAERRVRYLLDRMGKSEREAFERNYFENDALFEEVAAAEDDLIASYLRGELGFWTRRRFRRLYLSDPRRRKRVELVSGLIDVARPLAVEQSALRRPSRVVLAAAYAAGILLPCIVAGWALVREKRAVVEIAELRAVEQTFTIVPETELLRGPGRAVRWRVPPGVRTITLHLSRPEQAGPYTARVLTPEGTVVWATQGLRDIGADLGLSVSASALPPGDYIVFLESENGGARAAEYSFSIAR